MKGTNVLAVLAAVLAIAAPATAANSVEVDAHKTALREANVRFTYEFEKCSAAETVVERNKCRGQAKARHTKAVEQADAKALPAVRK